MPRHLYGLVAYRFCFQRIRNRPFVRNLAFGLTFILAFLASGVQGRAETLQQTPLEIKVGTFYYPWYGNATNSWKHWNEFGHNPPSTWASNYLPDKDHAQFSPSAELYDSNDDSTVFWQLGLMKEAGIQFAISSWWGINSYEDKAFRKILLQDMKKIGNPHPDLLWTIYYEKEGYGNPSESQITNDIEYLMNNYFSHPNFFKINGKGVIFIYADPNDEENMVTRWTNVRNSLGNIYVVLKVFPGYESYASWVDGWHQYAPANRFEEHLPFAAYVSPGFWRYHEAPRLARDLTTFDSVVAQLNSSTALFKLIETWNELHEGTQVEPAQEIIHDDVGEFRPANESYRTSFVDILAKYFGKKIGPLVGGIVVSVDRFGLFAPYIGLASTILVATVATSIYVKHVKRRKEK